MSVRLSNEVLGGAEGKVDEVAGDRCLFMTVLCFSLAGAVGPCSRRPGGQPVLDQQYVNAAGGGGRAGTRD